METSTGIIVEGQLEPINKTEGQRPLVVTGQGLYNMFMAADEGEKTRMAWIREYLVQNADAVQVQGATDSMVELAHAADLADGMPEKIVIDGKERKNRGPKQRSAMNVRTILRNIWGAIKFAEFDGQCGYNEAAVRARETLDAKGLVWNGGKKATDADRALKRTLKEQKAQTDALLDATKNTPRMLNESLASWQGRIALAAEQEIEKARQEANEAIARGAFEMIVSKGDGAAFELFAMLADKFGFDVKTEMTEEEANQALLDAAQAEDKIEVIEEEHVDA